jgi:uncharacterized protein (TIGR03084 family)
MSADPLSLLDDLAAEEDSLDRLVEPLDEGGWLTPTPAEGWDVRDQITHLAWVEEAARLAATDPDAFNHRFLEQAMSNPDFEAQEMQRGRVLPGAEVLEWWRRERAAAMGALRDVAAADPKARLPWFGPSMSLLAFTVARLMETWAHGQDVVDGLGLARQPTDRLRHIADLGVRTRGWSYAVRGRPANDAPVRVALALPSGEEAAWGEGDAADRVTGPALDFCLVVTQRRHWKETGLSVEGPAAVEWLEIAQAFAGRPTETRPDRTTR